MLESKRKSGHPEDQTCYTLNTRARRFIRERHGSSGRTEAKRRKDFLPGSQGEMNGISARRRVDARSVAAWPRRETGTWDLRTFGDQYMRDERARASPLTECSDTNESPEAVRGREVAGCGKM